MQLARLVSRIPAPGSRASWAFFICSYKSYIWCIKYICEFCNFSNIRCTFGFHCLVRKCPATFIHSFIRSFVHSFIHSLVHSFIRSFVHSFTLPYHFFSSSYYLLTISLSFPCYFLPFPYGRGGGRKNPSQQLARVIYL